MNLMQRGSQFWINEELVECQVANSAINYCIAHVLYA